MPARSGIVRTPSIYEPSHSSPVTMLTLLFLLFLFHVIYATDALIKERLNRRLRAASSLSRHRFSLLCPPSSLLSTSPYSRSCNHVPADTTAIGSYFNYPRRLSVTRGPIEIVVSPRERERKRERRREKESRSARTELTGIYRLCRSSRETTSHGGGCHAG